MTTASPGLAKMTEDFISEIRKRIRGDVKENEPMTRHTSFGIGGPADIWAVPESHEDVIALIDLCKGEGVPFTILGRGTNILVRDGGLRGVAISLTKACANLEAEGESVIAGAAVSLGALAKFAAKQGLRGLEFSTGIPGSVAGALATNAGAWGSDISQTLVKALVYDPENQESRSISKSEIGFGYRKSNLVSFGVILKAEFRLSPEKPETILDLMEQYMHQRSEGQPVGFKSAGCVFKNPPGGYAGALIDALGFKGYMCGDAMVSDVHANFIVNTGNATATDVLAIISEIKDRALAASGIELAEEIEILGTD